MFNCTPQPPSNDFGLKSRPSAASGESGSGSEGLHLLPARRVQYLAARHGARELRQAGKQAKMESGNQAIRQPGNQATRQPAIQPTNQPTSQPPNTKCVAAEAQNAEVPAKPVAVQQVGLLDWAGRLCVNLTRNARNGGCKYPAAQ